MHPPASPALIPVPLLEDCPLPPHRRPLTICPLLPVTHHGTFVDICFEGQRRRHTAPQIQWSGLSHSQSRFSHVGGRSPITGATTCCPPKRCNNRELEPGTLMRKSRRSPLRPMPTPTPVSQGCPDPQPQPFLACSGQCLHHFEQEVRGCSLSCPQCHLRAPQRQALNTGLPQRALQDGAGGRLCPFTAQVPPGLGGCSSHREVPACCGHHLNAACTLMQFP